MPAAVEAAHASFLEYRKLTPRQQAQRLMRWHTLICEARDDLAQILTHETDKPLAESYAELDCFTGFTWWYSGEADRIQGTASLAPTPSCRIFTPTQAIGVVAALVPWNFPLAMVLPPQGWGSPGRLLHKNHQAES